MFNLNLHNFRSFQNEHIEFSKINILIGENSGGKSSLLKFLLSLKQTLENPQEANLKLRGDYTDLGNYEEVIFNKIKSRKLKFGFESRELYHEYFKKNGANILGVQKAPQNIKDSILKIGDNGLSHNTEIFFEISSKLNEHNNINTIIRNNGLGELLILQKKGDKKNSSQRELNCDLEYTHNGKKLKFDNCIAFKEGFFSFVGHELKNLCEKKLKNKHHTVYYSIAYLLIFQNFIQEEILRMKFVNPIGTNPKRFYFQEDKKANYKMIDIEKFVSLMGDTESDKKFKGRIEMFNKIIKDFGIAEKIEVIKDKTLPVLALNVKTNGFWSNITDVGYGVSLQIPILFQALMSEKYTGGRGETILIEQPEVHLHPNLQAKFIETLLGIGTNNNYIIETHSEHIIRKLQVLVKLKKIKPADVTIHYFKRNIEKFEVTKHSILEDGKLSSPFPAGFYDTTYSLVKQLL